TLEIDIKQGKAKQYQIKDIERYVIMSKSGHSIKIEQVFDEPMPKLDGRGKDSVYGMLLQLVFTDYFLRMNVNHVIITRNNILEATNMLNSNYKYASTRTKQLSEYTKINRDIIKDFYNT